MDATKEEFFEKGYNGARIKSIAKRAGLNKQLIYHYFKGKVDELSQLDKRTNFSNGIP
ncbi:TetR/AcrR family transcriptional regulator [Halalkalibacter urbisdiaboli]|uniref:TetR/AcrR family transcriptional regulator n=1 Tax=Halalkalibacter urbisdiaboli TaxID=1960589 RepID=UPI001FDAB35B|nr:helix-turn-helix domain-containing protein [Halalkalibacter urbisdiaboli]